MGWKLDIDRDATTEGFDATFEAKPIIRLNIFDQVDKTQEA